MLLTLPGTSPTLFDTLATTGGTPKASSVGKVISDPEPTTALTLPAAVPAARIASATAGPTRPSHAAKRSYPCGPPRAAASVTSATHTGSATDPAAPRRPDRNPASTFIGFYAIIPPWREQRGNRRVVRISRISRTRLTSGSGT